jgi:hypothetical protein
MNQNLPPENRPSKSRDLPLTAIEQPSELFLEPGYIYKFTPIDLNNIVRIEYIPENEFDPLDLNIYISQGERSESNYLDLELPEAIKFLENKFRIKVTRISENVESDNAPVKVVKIKVEFSTIEYKVKSIELLKRD